jgi:hypothetical protein
MVGASELSLSAAASTTTATTTAATTSAIIGTDSAINVSIGTSTMLSASELSMAVSSSELAMSNVATMGPVVSELSASNVATMGWSGVADSELIGSSSKLGLGYFVRNAPLIAAFGEFADGVNYFREGKDVSGPEFMRGLGLNIATSSVGLAAEMTSLQFVESIFQFTGRGCLRRIKELAKMTAELGAAPFYNQNLYNGNASDAFAKYMTGVVAVEGILKPLGGAFGNKGKGIKKFENHTFVPGSAKDNFVNSWKKWAETTLPSRANGSIANIAATNQRLLNSRIMYMSKYSGTLGMNMGMDEDGTYNLQEQGSDDLRIGVMSGIATAFLGRVAVLPV